ncbi:ABC transporter ATP-binding protein [Pseudobutyrivibrio xylanivorans]|uniref:ABC-2 type transport system ATP-binding protein n=1 Tax=Pseudobutyrivibrio xylanivorans DSM 14809 TaxID=1123012 RepID=A0A1M6L3W9_PSEXY|nr:ABC transporter ATP-binding protein [Pseudobutyrivibrio xylanivorans]SHJ65908.1 ABC-2 type transport system ATP-binding protein [Pseudobutyrivibrio xylanivorans DSM 14809]
MGTLSGKNITKTYGKDTVLKNVNIDIETGKIYGLIGRNGAGKTTLLSILTAQNPTTEGTVTLDGQPVWENEESLSHICYSREISQVTMFGPNTLKVKDYLSTGKAFYKNWDDDYAKELVKLFNINPKKKVSKLSKGMLSAVTIIIALASKADITILDEPVAGLDVVAREQFYKLVIEEYAQTGRTFIISTHIIEEAASLFEKVIIIDNGEIILTENTEELLARAYRVSGETEAVDLAVEGFKVYHPESIGRNKVVTVLAEEPVAGFGEDVQVEPVALQNLFYAMCVDERKEA